MSWEPLLVTTLRHYVRRGAPDSLLRRLAGGLRDWRLLNESWGLDGRYVPPPAHAPIEVDALSAPIPRLSTEERRLLLVQLVADYAEANALMPSDGELAHWLGITASQIWLDFQALIGTGRLCSRIGSSGVGTTRRVLRVPGSEYSTADPNDMVRAW